MLARLWHGTRAGWIAIALLATYTVFAYKTSEIRPDVLALVLWLGCLVALMLALSKPTLSTHRRAMLFALSGALLGGAIMSTQKLLMATPALALAMLWYAAAGDGEWQTRMRQVALLCIGFAMPVLATLGYFWSRGALGAFINCNLLMNLHWQLHRPPSRLFHSELNQSPAVLIFGGLALVWAGWREFRQRGFSAGKLMILVTIGPIAGLWAMPVAQEQYNLTFLPLLAILAGALMVAAADAIRADALRSENGTRRHLIAAGFLGIGAIALLGPHGPLWLKLGSVALLAAGIALMIGARTEAALAIVLCALCLPPYCVTRNAFLIDNAETLKTLHYVIEKTSPAATMMDGWTGYGVFRPHAYFYWFLHDDMLAMLSHEQRAELFADLQSGKLAPDYIVPGFWMGAVADQMPDFVRNHYRPIPGEPAIWERKVIAR